LQAKTSLRKDLFFCQKFIYTRFFTLPNKKTKHLAKRLQQNVQRLLIEKNWTMQELADKAKLSIGTIQEINQGKMTNPRLQTIVDLSDGFGISNPLELLQD
jgi:DNA-binding Xre family transcriptional regulator